MRYGRIWAILSAVRALGAQCTGIRLARPRAHVALPGASFETRILPVRSVSTIRRGCYSIIIIGMIFIFIDDGSIAAATDNTAPTPFNIRFDLRLNIRFDLLIIFTP